MASSAKRAELLEMLRSRSVFYGDFVLSSGSRSSHYFDCKLTTLSPPAAWLVGELVVEQIREFEEARGIKIAAVGGLTMGADPISLAAGMVSYRQDPGNFLDVFIVRKTPKAHGQTKLIEGAPVAGRTVVVIDDVVTRGDATIAAIEAIRQEGGIVALAVVLVDREEGGRAKIEERGVPVVSVFRKSDILQDPKSVTGSAIGSGAALDAGS